MKDHEMLLASMKRSFGVQGQVIAWFRSYLIDQTYSVIYTAVPSFIKQVTCFILQESVLGPLLFLLYAANLADLTTKHGVMLYAFTDDKQLYIHCEFKNMAT